MKSKSTAYIKVKDTGDRYYFDGVVSVSHALTLKVSTDSDSSAGADYINNARSEPEVVTLSVVSSDVYAPKKNKAKASFRALAEIREKRLLCRLVTSLKTYRNMLLTDLSVLQDETCPYGWTATLTFTQADPPSSGTKPNDNSSTPNSSGNTAGGGSVSSSGSAVSGSGSSGGGLTLFHNIMHRAGIQL